MGSSQIPHITKKQNRTTTKKHTLEWVTTYKTFVPGSPCQTGRWLCHLENVFSLVIAAACVTLGKGLLQSCKFSERPGTCDLFPLESYEHSSTMQEEQFNSKKVTNCQIYQKRETPKAASRACCLRSRQTIFLFFKKPTFKKGQAKSLAYVYPQKANVPPTPTVGKYMQRILRNNLLESLKRTGYSLLSSFLF